ncbi:MAG TPA: BTAD domain-containing putative transcriptional regulator [Jiangellaceae bacterium]
MIPELTLLPRVAYRGHEVTSPRLRSLLALLAADLRVGATTSRLLDGLWRDEQPENPIKALQILVSRARAQLGSELIATTPTGYRLSLDEDQVDAAAILRRVTDSARHARAGDHEATLAAAEAGLALWDGSLDDDPAGDPVAKLRADRRSAHRSLVRFRALALARLGRHSEAIDSLMELAAERPRDEELLLELLRSEAATAGPSAALVRYEAYRGELRDELGADPGADLQAFHRTLLLSTAPAVRRGLAHEPNPLLGRDEDISTVERLLRASRVTSIIGPGGLGKTRLAQAVLQRAEHRAGFFVPLAGISTDEDVLSEVAAVLGAGDSPRTPGGAPAHSLVDGIVTAIGPGPALLVLDNCEHVLRGVAGLVQSLIAKTSELRVLSPSRAPLGLMSESVYQLPELSLATMIELFIQRARAARPDVALPPDAVEEICRHLDGLPLAVELAAARVRVMSVAEIAERLDDRFSLLRGGARDLPERHHTLRAVVSWSWNLLHASDQRAMRLLSVLPGGFTAETAGTILSGDALDVLERLVEQSLLTVSDTAIGTRFRMLETVREFSASELTSAGEQDEAIAKLLAWARAVGLEHCPGIAGAERYSSVDAIRAEQENLGYALRLAVDRDDGRTVAATAAVLGFLSMVESNFVRMSGLVQDVSWLLSHYRPEPEDLEVTRTALALNVLYTFLLEGPKAKRSLVALRRLPDPSPATFAGAVSIIFAAVRGDPSALVKLTDSEYPYVAAGASLMASYNWEAENDIDRAIVAAERSLEAVEGQGLPWLEAQAHARIGELCFQLERGADAVHHLSAALPVIERLGARTDALGLRWWIVLANLQRGDVDEAQRWAEPATDVHVEPKLGTLGYDVGARAELSLACGDIDGGLQKWRQVIGLLDNARGETSAGVPILLDPWQVEARAVALTAHAQHGKVELVADLPANLEERLTNLLTSPIVNPPPYLMEFQLGGSALVALAVADLDAARRTSDGTAATSAVQMIALSERFGYLRNFQPTMASGRIRAMAQSADRPAYEAAVSSYAGLDREALRAEALAMLRLRPS